LDLIPCRDVCWKRYSGVRKVGRVSAREADTRNGERGGAGILDSNGLLAAGGADVLIAEIDICRSDIYIRRTPSGLDVKKQLSVC
jgi:hypothetical protein